MKKKRNLWLFRIGTVLCFGIFCLASCTSFPEAISTGTNISSFSSADLSVSKESSFSSQESSVFSSVPSAEESSASSAEAASGSEVLEMPSSEASSSGVWEVPGGLVPYAGVPYYITVNKQENCVTIYGLDSQNQYYSVPVKAMICSTGPYTPEGTFRTSDQYRWRLLIHNVWGQYATRITGSILFHSVPYWYQDPSTLQGEEYNKLGTSASAGCVRLTVEDAKWILDYCPSGTLVTIYSSSDPGPLGKPSIQKIPEDAQWDPTDPDPLNPWNQA